MSKALALLALVFVVACSNTVPAYMGECSEDAQCVVVPHHECCSPVIAINSNYLAEYNEHPQWQTQDAAACAAVTCPAMMPPYTASCQEQRCVVISS